MGLSAYFVEKGAVQQGENDNDLDEVEFEDRHSAGFARLDVSIRWSVGGFS